MASTVTQITARFRSQFYPDCTSTETDRLWQEAWNNAVYLFRLRETSIDITLTEGVREYDLDGTVTGIREAYYVPSADDSTWNVLYGVSIDQLARVEPGWRANDNESTPNRFYIKAKSSSDGGKRIIGIDPLPFQTTSGSYPVVRLYVIQRAELTGSETVPDFLLSDEWFLYEMAYRWSIRQDRTMVGQWKQLRDDEQGKWAAYIRGASDDVPSQVFISPFSNFSSTPV